MPTPEDMGCEQKGLSLPDLVFPSVFFGLHFSFPFIQLKRPSSAAITSTSSRRYQKKASRQLREPEGAGENFQNSSKALRFFKPCVSKQTNLLYKASPYVYVHHAKMTLVVVRTSRHIV